MNIYLTNIKDADIRELQKYISWCDEKRQQSIQKYRFEGDKKRGIAAGLLLRYAYRTYQKQNHLTMADRVILDYGKHGKPSIRGEEKFHFSLSHAGDYILLAWDTAEVGADIECIERKKKALAMAKRFYTQDEYSYLEAIENEAECDKEFIRIWTQKESYIKLLGYGLQYGMNSFWREANGLVTDSKREDKKCISIHEIQNIPGYCASVCYIKDENVCGEDTFMIQDIPIEILIK